MSEKMENWSSAKKGWMLFLLSVICLLLTGCTTIDGKVPGKREVLAYVDEVCEEPYDLLSVEQIAERPADVEYVFETEERGLRFTAHSYLQNIYIDASATGFYSKEISCDYVSVMHELYYDRAKEKLKGAERYSEEREWFGLLEFSDIEHAARAILEADKVYAEELAYNSPEYLKEHSLMGVHFVWYESKEAAKEDKSWVNMTNIPVTGSQTYEEIYDTLADCYAQLCVDGKIEDRGEIPASYLEGKHVSTLEHIYLDGKEMLYEDRQNPFNPYRTTTEDYRYCWYNQELDSYMMVSDVGYISESSSVPLITAEYVHALGGTYEVNAKKNMSRWTIGENQWEMKASFSESPFRVENLQVRKNGAALELPYLTVDDDSSVRGAFGVGLTVDDFAKLFDLKYEINETEKSIYFTSN